MKGRNLSALAGGICALFHISAEAAIEFVATSTAIHAGETSRTPTEPTGTQENDLVLAACALHQSEDGTWTDPSDFTQIDQLSGQDALGQVYVGYKVRGPTAGDGYTFSYSGASNAIRCSLATFRGVDTSTPFDVTYASGSHRNGFSNNPDTAAPAITTSTNGAWVLTLAVRSGDVSTAADPPSNYTMRVSNIGGNPEINLASREIASAGEETPGAWSITDAANADGQNFTLALRPAAGGSALLLRRRLEGE